MTATKVADLAADLLDISIASLVTNPAPERQYASHGEPPWDCLVGSTMIPTARGAVPLSEVVPGDEVWAWDEGHMVKSPVLAHIDKGTQEVFRVRTPRRSITGTANHRMLCLRRRYARTYGGRPQEFFTEWVTIGDLRRGDLLITMDHLDDDGTDEVSPTLAWLIGVLVGDGTVGPDGFRVCVYGNLRDRVSQAVTELWGLKSRPHPKHGLMVCSAAVRDQLTAMGMATLGPKKRVPGPVWGWNHKLIDAFLRGYREADGHVSKATGHWAYATASPELCREVRMLHMMIGDAVSNLHVQERTAPIVIRGKTVRNALPLHRFSVYPDSPRGQRVLLDSSHARRALPDHRFAVDRIRDVIPMGMQPTFDIEVEGTHNFVADGLVAHNCEQLTVHVVRIRPKLLNPIDASKCMVVWVAVLQVVLLRCALTPDELGNPPSAADLTIQNEALHVDGWELTSGLSGAWAAGNFPPSGRCAAVTWGNCEPFTPAAQGGLTGWRQTVEVELI